MLAHSLSGIFGYMCVCFFSFGFVKTDAHISVMKSQIKKGNFQTKKEQPEVNPLFRWMYILYIYMYVRQRSQRMCERKERTRLNLHQIQTEQWAIWLWLWMRSFLRSCYSLSRFFGSVTSAFTWRFLCVAGLTEFSLLLCVVCETWLLFSSIDGDSMNSNA